MNKFLNDLEGYEPVSFYSVDLPEEVDSYCHKPSTFSFFHLNIRSLRKHFDELLIVLSELQTKFQIIILTESWLTEENHFFRLPGYVNFHNLAKNNQSDSTTIFIREELGATVTDLNWASANATGITLDLENHTFNILTVYRSPSLQTQYYLNELANYIETNEPNIILGDINIDLTNITNRNLTDNYLNLLTKNYFVSCINEPTRITPNNKSCLDHIFIKPTRFKPTALVYKISLTDHFATILSLDTGKYSNPSSDTRTNSYIDYGNLRLLLSNESWDEVNQLQDSNKSTQTFIQILQTHINECTKIKPNISAKHRKLKPWITTGLIKSIRTRERKRKQVLKQPFNVELNLAFQSYCDILKTLIENTKNEFYKNKLKQADCKSTWKIIKDVTNDNSRQNNISNIKINNTEIKVDSGGKQIANIFNNYFLTITEDLANNILQSGVDLTQNVQETVDSRFILPQLTQVETLKYLNNLKPKYSAGKDNISAITLIKIKDLIIKPLTHVFNLIIKSGTYPNCLKCAIVKPLYKNGPKNSVSSYRPICLISNISKVLEYFIKEKLMYYLEQNNIISNNQFGFRQKMNTQQALTKFTTQIYDAFESNKKCLALFLDLSKAFDTVSHDILIKKLWGVGIRGVELRLLTSYITERFQQVQINSDMSDSRELKYGVAQGSVLGPCLFTIYANFICNANLDNCDITSFADDTVLSFTSNSWEETFVMANNGINTIKSLLDENLLTLNVQKTKYVTFSQNLSNTDNLTIKIHNKNCDRLDCNCDIIEKKSEIKYLGIVVDTRLQWKQQIESLNLKLRRIMYKFYQLRNIFNPDSLKLIYFSLVQSTLQYGICSWGGAFQTYLKKLKVTQKAVLKIILKKPRRYPSHQLFEEAKILDIDKLYLKFILLNSFDALNNISPIHTHLTRFQTNYNIPVPLYTKTITQQQITYTSVKNFNNLPTYLKSIKEKNLFKKELNKYLSNL